MEEHEKILIALSNRDGDTLSKSLEAHLLHKKEAIKAALEIGM